ncbi:hypothetical protein K3495_g11669 [Podosphaera aphanis]|nr:hypothetical protein K3495_g11669 [Podosphaera aphanis]
MPKQYGISNSQRRGLRVYAAQHPRLTQHQLKAWFEEEFQRTITQASISESLSSKYNYLDNDTMVAFSQQRERPPKWPELDEALALWQKEKKKSIPITGHLIRQQAIRFWNRLPCYQGMEVPAFSNGWLGSFKKRHGIKSRTQHGEDGSVNEAVVAQQLAQVQELATEYHPDDIYNCDESDLFWKMTPERGLSTTSVTGSKKNKARVIAHFCCNASGRDKLPIWFIGTSANPRFFGSAGINTGAFNCVWKSNGKAWMTADLMVEWLEYFAHRIGSDRKVLLIMDNFSAHVSAYQKIQQSLSYNVTVCWLPPNSTSRTQPLDQGIIRAFKASYRKRWLEFMLDEYESERNPLQTVNVLKAIRWSIQAWNSVTELTIKNCWSKTEILPIEHQPTFGLQAAEEARVLRLVAQLEQDGRIQHAMSIDNLLNSDAEVVEHVLNHEDLEEQIVELFDPPIIYESTEEEEILPSITNKQALEALNTLRLYEEQRGDNCLITHLDDREEVYKRRIQDSKQQRSITDWLT